MKFIRILLVFILLNGLVFYGLDHFLFLENFTVTGGLLGYGIVALIFGVVQTIIKPLLRIITLPLKILTLGLIHFIINGLLLWILQQFLLFLNIANTSLVIHGIITYILAGLILALVNAFLGFFKTSK